MGGWERITGELAAFAKCKQRCRLQFSIVEAAYRKFLENPNHQSLHRKELHDTHRGQHRRGSWSVRVTLKYRAIYVLDGDTNVWYWIGSHSDYNIFTGEN